MKIGYPCINNSLSASTNGTFRLASYSEEKLMATVSNNLTALQTILAFNIEHDLMFFRIGSGFVPFASHSVCTFDWKKQFANQLKAVGQFIKDHSIRISMHPDQFVLINALDQKIVDRSVAELHYHCDLLDALELDQTAKVQIHVGGLYGDKPAAMQRFIANYHRLPDAIKQRLVIENDDRLFDATDCLFIHQETHIPIIFDIFHHECLNHQQHTTRDALAACAATWREQDGVPMLDYSSQAADGRVGKHTDHIDITHFKRFVTASHGFDIDVMLEIKDKEISALLARKNWP